MKNSVNLNRITALVLSALTLIGVWLPLSAEAATPSETGYADSGGLQIYYETYGTGAPLVLLHGGMTNIQISFAPVLDELAAEHLVIAIEQQGHGHTADRDAPFSYEQMADDTVAVLKHLGVAEADFFGWSDGANTAIQVALRHPEHVRRLVLLGASIDNEEALGQEMLDWMANASAEDFGPMLAEAYAAVSPHPDGWPAYVEKYIDWQVNYPGLDDSVLAGINKPALVMSGDRGGDNPAHTVRIFEALPNARIAIFPGTTHFTIAERPDWVLATVQDYLASDLAEPEMGVK